MTARAAPSSAPARSSCCRPARSREGSARASRSSSPSSPTASSSARTPSCRRTPASSCPADTETSAREVFWRMAAGRSYFHESLPSRVDADAGAGRSAGSSSDGEHVLWDVVPQMQVSLSRRQHVRVSGGLQLPRQRARGPREQFLMYLLWDWFDGGLFCRVVTEVPHRLDSAGSASRGCSRSSPRRQPSGARRRARGVRRAVSGVDLFTLSSNCMACHNGL